jgi:hypothetical protein
MKSLSSLEVKDSDLDNVGSKDVELFQLCCLQDDSMFETYHQI